MRTCQCPRCGTLKTRLAPRRSVTDRLLSTFTIYPLRCQLCTHRFTTFLGKLKTNPRRNYDRISVEYPAQVRPIHDPSTSIVVEGTVSNLSLRGCRVLTKQRVPMGCKVMLEFHPAEYDDPIMVDGAIVRSRSAEGIGLRFSSLLHSEERRLRRILDLRLPDHAI
ncbi:MAG: PilZ domain-containing protein [Nitrospira sp. CG24E]|nr:MAG: PilZ domain-containing protein [Nitrospira sp. CG24E]